MISLILDTETSGFVRKFEPTHPGQARMLEIAIVLLDPDLKEVDGFSTLVKHKGRVEISQGAFGVHGITNEMCQKDGVPLAGIIDLLEEIAQDACKVVCFNAKFDKNILALAYAQAGTDTSKLLALPWECCMEMLTPVMRLQRSNGSSKFPNLAEAYRYCTGSVAMAKHAALGDARSTADIWRWLQTKDSRVDREE